MELEDDSRPIPMSTPPLVPVGLLLNVPPVVFVKELGFEVAGLEVDDDKAEAISLTVSPLRRSEVPDCKKRTAT